MTSKSHAELTARVHEIAAESQQVLDALLEEEPLIAGSVSRILRKCGKPNCHCAAAPSHMTVHLKTSHNGVQRCQFVRKADVDDVLVKVARYRHFQQLEARLDALHGRLRDAIAAVRSERSDPYC